MKDAGFPLQKAYFSLFTGLMYGEAELGFYSVKAPDDAQKPYVIIGPWIGRPDNSKYTFGQNGEIVLDVVTEFFGNNWSRQPAAEIADLLTERLLPEPTSTVLDVSGFNVVITLIGPVQDIDLATERGTLVRKLITVTHSLNQL